MKAFWWFEKNVLAGMARPGFNRTHWFDLPYDEAVLMGWLGHYSSGPAKRSQIHSHLETYAPKIAKFYKFTEREVFERTEKLKTDKGFQNTLEQLSERTHLFENFEVTEDEVYFQFCSERLDYEIQFLKENGFKKIITLTEHHHNKEILEDYFDLHHFSIQDLNVPSHKQVVEMATVIKKAKEKGETIGVHCLAGIGRTSSTIIAAYMLMGFDIKSLREKMTQANPSFKWTESQNEFIENISKKNS